MDLLHALLLMFPPQRGDRKARAKRCPWEIKNTYYLLSTYSMKYKQTHMYENIITSINFGR